MLNDHSMYEHIIEDDLFFGVVGMLECTCFLCLLHPHPTLIPPNIRRSRVPYAQSQLPRIPQPTLPFSPTHTNTR